MSSSAVQTSTTPNIVSIMGTGGKEIDLTRNTVYLQLSLHALGTSRKVPEALWGNLGLVGADDDQFPDPEAEKLNKKLFDVSKKLFDSPTLTAIRSFDGHLRDWVRKKCLPYIAGTHFLPHTLVNLVDDHLSRSQRQRARLVDQFLAEYPALCRAAARGLTRKFFNIDDYPTLEEVASRFWISWQYLRIRVPDELEQINREIYETETRNAAQQMRQAVSDIEAMLRDEALNLVRKLSDALQVGKDGRKKRLTDGAFTNLAEFLAFFDHRNVTNDGELKRIVEELRRKLGENDVEHVRNSVDLRQQMAREMSAITQQLSSMVELVPRRKMTLH